jgi:type I restriction enzyme S subunit
MNSITALEFPAGWKVKKLGELCSIQLGKTPYRKNPKFWDKEKRSGNVWLSIADLKHGQYVSESSEQISDLGANDVVKVPKGTMLISFKLTLGRVSFAGCDLYTNEAIASLINLEINISKQFAFYYFCLFNWEKAAEGDIKVKGKTLNKQKLKELPIPLPPLSEQRRIVSILDNCFAAIDMAKANAEKNLQNARELFESYLQGVFEGKGEGWDETSLYNETNLIVGFAFKSKMYTNNNDDVLLIKGDNIMQGYFRWDDVKRWDKNEYDMYQKYQLQKNDILLAMDRPWVKSGLKIAIISDSELPSLLVQRTACLRSNNNIEYYFLFYLMNSKKFINHLFEAQTGIGVPHISGKQITDFKFFRPPIHEQQFIVRRLDALRTETQKLEAVYKQKLADMEELKKSLLEKAFRGELTTDKKITQ